MGERLRRQRRLEENMQSGFRVWSLHDDEGRHAAESAANMVKFDAISAASAAACLNIGTLRCLMAITPDKPYIHHAAGGRQRLNAHARAACDALAARGRKVRTSLDQGRGGSATCLNRESDRSTAMAGNCHIFSWWDKGEVYK